MSRLLKFTTPGTRDGRDHSPCLFSIFNYIKRFANEPVVISKMEHLDPWPEAGGWQTEGALVFSFSPHLAHHRFRWTIWCWYLNLDSLHIWNSHISNICFCLSVWQPHTHHRDGRWHHSTDQVCTCNGSGCWSGLVSQSGNLYFKIFLYRMLLSRCYPLFSDSNKPR